MQLLREIYHRDVELENSDVAIAVFDERKAVRAVLFDDDGRVAVLNVRKYVYHKLPGGGMENRETMEQTLERECLEEAGCRIEINQELGRIVEYRDYEHLRQESFCFAARVVGEKGQPAFTSGEHAADFVLQWMDLDAAIALLESDRPEGIEGRFIRLRDLTFLKTV